MTLGATLAFSLDLKSLSYGTSKLFQLLIPLSAVILFQFLPFRKNLLGKLVALLGNNTALVPEEEQAEINALGERFNRVIGFFAWKVGCDLGFFLINTEYGTWERAFTFSGLIPYTIVQYLLHRIVGQNMFMDGFLNPFSNEIYSPPEMKRPNPLKLVLSKYLYEDMGGTSYNVRIRKVLLKPLVDYTSMVASWSAYSMGIFFFQSGEINLAPLVHFDHKMMLCFYMVGYFGYIVGFNVGELIYFALLNLIERQAVDRRQKQELAVVSWQTAWKFRFQELKYIVSWKFQEFLKKYGINLRWLVSISFGVMFVILLTPGFTRFFNETSSNLNELWFEKLGQMDLTQVEQVQQVAIDHSYKLPNSQEVLEGFPSLWIEMYKNEGQIAGIAK